MCNILLLFPRRKRFDFCYTSLLQNKAKDDFV